MSLTPQKIVGNDPIRQTQSVVNANADIQIVSGEATAEGFVLQTEGGDEIALDLTGHFITRAEAQTLAGVNIATEDESGRLPISSEDQAKKMEDDGSAMTPYKVLLALIARGIPIFEMDGAEDGQFLTVALYEDGLRIKTTNGRSLKDLLATATEEDKSALKFEISQTWAMTLGENNESAISPVVTGDARYTAETVTDAPKPDSLAAWMKTPAGRLTLESMSFESLKTKLADTTTPAEVKPTGYMSISGPESVTEGSSGQYVLLEHMSDGTKRPYTGTKRWSLPYKPNAAINIDATTGILTAPTGTVAPGDYTNILVTWGPNNETVSSSATLVDVASDDPIVAVGDLFELVQIIAVVTVTARRIDGTGLLVEGGTAGTYSITEVLSNGSQRQYTGAGDYAFSGRYPNGMGITRLTDATALTSIPKGTLESDVTLILTFTLPDGTVISRSIAGQKAIEAPVTVSSYRLDGTETLTEGGSAGTYWITAILSNNTERAYTGAGVFAFVGNYPNGQGITQANNGTASTAVPANTIESNVTLVLKFTLPDGSFVAKNIAAINNDPAIQVVSRYIDGPDAITEGGSGTFVLKEKLTDGTTRSYADPTGWNLNAPPSMVIIGATSGIVNVPTDSIPADTNLIVQFTLSGQILQKVVALKNLASAVTVVSRIIDGPASVAEKSTGQYTLKEVLSDGSVRNFGGAVAWIVAGAPSQLITVNGAGLLNVPDGSISADGSLTLRATPSGLQPVDKSIKLINTTAAPPQITAAYRNWSSDRFLQFWIHGTMMKYADQYRAQFRTNIVGAGTIQAGNEALPAWAGNQLVELTPGTSTSSTEITWSYQIGTAYAGKKVLLEYRIVDKTTGAVIASQEVVHLEFTIPAANAPAIPTQMVYPYQVS